VFLGHKGEYLRHLSSMEMPAVIINGHSIISEREVMHTIDIRALFDALYALAVAYVMSC
jgi:hypothetical protein